MGNVGGSSPGTDPLYNFSLKKENEGGKKDGSLPAGALRRNTPPLQSLSLEFYRAQPSPDARPEDGFGAGNALPWSEGPHLETPNIRLGFRPA